MKKVSFNKNWVFHEGDGSTFAAVPEGAITKNVTLPHDASVEKERNPEETNGNGNGFFREETIHYTKEFAMDAADVDKNIWLEFEGIYQNAYVYVNGAYAGRCPYGYSNYYLDITKYVRFDKMNNIKVIIKNGVPSGRWYTGGGIYRDVNIMLADRLHLIPDSVHLAAVDVEGDRAVIRAESVIEYTGIGTRGVSLEMELLDARGKIVAQDSMPITVEERTKQSYFQKLCVDAPRLWDEDQPYLYTYCVRIKEGDTILDEETGTFGIRRLQLDAKHGLRVNGKVLKLRGGCIHHDNGVIGAVEFAHAAEHRVKKLKEAGYNTLRSSHYPMSRKLLEACDKLGVYVMDEFSDVWTSTKVDFDYGIHMVQWWEQDVINIVNKDYNHPCVIMYSIGNEIPETGNIFDVQWGKKLSDKFRALDDTRYTTNCLNLLLSIRDHLDDMMGGMEALADTGEPAEGTDIGNMEINNAMNSFEETMNTLIASETTGKVTAEAFGQVDVAGYNYAAIRYEQDAKEFPNRVIVGSETYPKDLDKNWELVEKYPHLIGDFAWTAWDYLGETGIGKITYGEKQGMGFYAAYPYKVAYCGDINLIGDRRPVSYWREIIWGLRKAPYVSVQPPQYYGVEHGMTQWSMTDAVRSWNWAGYEGKPVIVEVYADADEVALYVNKELIEKKKVGESKKYMVLFDTVYVPGTVEAVSYKNGMEVARDTLVTADENVKILAYADREQIPADESDICYIEISVVDSHGNLNPASNKEVTISIDGPGIIQGYGSAVPVSEENYFDKTAKTFEGRLRAAIRGTGEKGTITVSLSSEGCEKISVQVKAI